MKKGLNIERREKPNHPVCSELNKALSMMKSPPMSNKAMSSSARLNTNSIYWLSTFSFLIFSWLKQSFLFSSLYFMLYFITNCLLAYYWFMSLFLILTKSFSSGK